MYKNHLKLQDIHIGDWVQECSKITGRPSIPMYVSAIFKDGTIYLDFNGNEGDVWETDIEKIFPITIDKDILHGFGFEFDFDVENFKLKVDDSYIYADGFQYGIEKWLVQFREEVRIAPICTYIHELQHAYYNYARKPLILNWNGI
ncbi:hypothetical protein [Bacteroides pyogenes]|uniref:hypothetical protein n=1 Tax=Bacteroides pyogenes TaxID=310300 RepID=UPI002FDB09CD